MEIIILISISNNLFFSFYFIQESIIAYFICSITNLIQSCPFLKLLICFSLLKSYSWIIFCIFFRFLSPLSAVPLVALSGFGLYELGFPVVYIFAASTSSCFLYIFYDIMCDSHFVVIFEFQLAKCVEIGLPEIIILVVFSQVINKFIIF